MKMYEKLTRVGLDVSTVRLTFCGDVNVLAVFERFCLSGV
jgi:hypothetical protein